MIRISERDKRLLDLLARYEIIGSRQIRELLFNGIPETNFFRRMRELEKAKMIRRIGPMTDHCYAWLLGPKAKERMGLGERDLFKTRLTLEHDVTLTQVRMALGAIGVGKKFVAESELRKRARLQQTGYLEKKKQVVVPDGLFPVLIKERAEVFALEVELNFKNRLRYQELLKISKWMASCDLVRCAEQINGRPLAPRVGSVFRKVPRPISSQNSLLHRARSLSRGSLECADPRSSRRSENLRLVATAGGERL